MKISKITLGTANFGQNYGLRKSKNKLSKHDAKLIIRKALSIGINSFDTSPNYGFAESILGETLRKSKSFVATKIVIPKKKINFSKLLLSINKSRKNLCTHTLDLLQIHNAQKKTFKNQKLKEFFLDLKKKKIIKKIGATIYTENEALAAISSKWVNSIQVPYNLINQTMAKKVFRLAKKHKIKVFTRSTFLKGVLTERIILLPKKLNLIKHKIFKNLDELELTIQDLKTLSFYFSSSNNMIDSIVIGVENVYQLNEIFKLKNKKLSRSYLKKLSIFNNKSKISDPRLWPFI